MVPRRILTIFPIISIAASIFDLAQAQGRDHRALRQTIVLFGAHWCAPCRAELRDLPELAASAAPRRLVLGWIDRMPTPSPANVETLVPAEAQALALRLGGEGYGLPFAAIFDDAGRLCRVWRKPLHSPDIRTVAAACDADGVILRPSAARQ